MVDHLVMMRWIIGSILHSGPWYVLSSCDVLHTKDPVLLNRKNGSYSGSSGFPPGFMRYQTLVPSQKQMTLKIPNFLAINSQTG